MEEVTPVSGSITDESRIEQIANAYMLGEREDFTTGLTSYGKRHPDEIYNFGDTPYQYLIKLRERWDSREPQHERIKTKLERFKQATDYLIEFFSDLAGVADNDFDAFAQRIQTDPRYRNDVVYGIVRNNQDQASELHRMVTQAVTTGLELIGSPARVMQYELQRFGQRKLEAQFPTG